MKLLSPLFLLATIALLAASAAAQSRTIYFYPPDDAKWIAGRSYATDLVSTPKPLTLDNNRCGWYKVTISYPYIQFWLGKSGTDIIGPKGRFLTDFENEASAAEIGGFDLDAISDLLQTNTLYFIADEMEPGVLGSGWYSTNPGIEDESRCRFNLAAFIYDTDKSVNPSFSDYKDDIDCGKDQYGAWTAGIIKGMVKNTLTRDFVNGEDVIKMECDRCNGGKGAFNNKEEFDWAFKTYKKGDLNAKNVKLCYDMPFTQNRANGSFEFDSDSLRNAAKKHVGGFFPEILSDENLSAAAIVPGTADYDDCPDCRKPHTAESYVGLTNKINPWCFERGFQTKTTTGTTMASCGAAYGMIPGPNGEYGHFAHGSYPADTWGATCSNRSDLTCGSADWNGAWRDTTLNLWGDPACGKISSSLSGTHNANGACKANMLFCFESHAQFMYDPEQEFFFRGDDDIWVFINNKLVIDLGGTHLAAPGAVELNTLGLTEGEIYPIDIFFCDRRAGMSNIRISTNMYVSQKSNFYNNSTKNKGGENWMCASIQSGADCASKMNSSTDGDMCGPALAQSGYEIQFFMIERGKPDTTWLSSTKNPAKCVGDALNFTCYNGIKITDGAVYTCAGKSQCKGNSATSSQVSLIGNWNIYSRLADAQGNVVPGAKSLFLDNINQKSTSVIAGSNNLAPKTQEPKYYTLKGEPLGNKKPSKLGVYIMLQNGIGKKIVVRE